MEKIIEQIDYADFSTEFRNRHSSGLPVKGGIELTSRCNLNCRHCYMPHSGFRGAELSYKEITGILDQIADAGCIWLLLTGGEPLLRNDFSKIYCYAKKKGFLVSVYTNGTLVDSGITALFSEYPPFCAEVTLYGASKETYESITEREGSFRACMDGIRMLRKERIPMRLKTMVMNGTGDELEKMSEFASALGVTFYFDTVINPGLDGSMAPCGMRLAPSEVVSKDMTSAKRTEAFRDKFRKMKNGEKTYNGYLYECGAGMGSFHITSDGKLNLCEMASEPSYDLKRGSFREGYYEMFPQVRAKKRSGPSECAECEISSLCPQCPALARLEKGDSEAIVDYYCEIAHIRYGAIIEGICDINKIGKEKMTTAEQFRRTPA